MKTAATGLTMVLALVVHTAWSQPPQMIAYQGLITDDTGAPVADGTYSLTFRIIDAETGGTELWSETQPSVAVSSGLFTVFLGSVTPIELDFTEPYWLETQIESGQPQFPRIRLTSVPYSYTAVNADQVDGYDAEATPTANTLLPLDATGQFPEDAIPSVPPGGAAGGDLTGTYPNPSIANDAVTGPKIQAGAVNTSDLADDAVRSGKIEDGHVRTADIADDAVTVAKIAPDVVSSIDGVSNDGGDIDLVAGSNVSITPDDGANTITIASSGGGEGDITSVWPGDATLTGGGRRRRRHPRCRQSAGVGWRIRRWGHQGLQQ